jgi:cell filamentation protein
MNDESYVFPGTTVLRNKARLTDQQTLDDFEARMVTERARRGVPSGKFDLTHLKAIHRHLFQDVYAWAGELRTVEISKDGHQFMFRRFMESGMADVHRRIVAAKFFAGLDRARFAEVVGPILGDVNYVHPFREGNGRTQLHYLKQLAATAGHPLDLREIDPARWLAASRRAHAADYQPMSAVILDALERS